MFCNNCVKVDVCFIRTTLSEVYINTSTTKCPNKVDFDCKPFINPFPFTVGDIIYRFNPLKTGVQEWEVTEIIFGRFSTKFRVSLANQSCVIKDYNDLPDFYLTLEDALNKLKEIRGE